MTNNGLVFIIQDPADGVWKAVDKATFDAVPPGTPLFDFGFDTVMFKRKSDDRLFIVGHRMDDAEEGQPPMYRYQGQNVSQQYFDMYPSAFAEELMDQEGACPFRMALEPGYVIPDVQYTKKTASGVFNVGSEVWPPPPAPPVVPDTEPEPDGE